MSIRTKLATGREVWKRYKSHHDHGDKTCRDKTTTTQNGQNSFLKSVTCDQNGGRKKIELLQSAHPLIAKTVSKFVNGYTHTIHVNSSQVSNWSGSLKTLQKSAWNWWFRQTMLMSTKTKNHEPKTGVVKKLNNFQMLQLPTIQLDSTHFRKSSAFLENWKTGDMTPKHRDKIHF